MKHLKIVEEVAPWCLTISYRISKENIRRKKVIELLILKHGQNICKSSRNNWQLWSFQWCIPKTAIFKGLSINTTTGIFQILQKLLFSPLKFLHLKH